MSKVDRINKSLNESFSKDISSLKDLKEGSNVVFKEGTPEAGMTAYVVQLHPERNTVDVKFGKATRMDVPIADLMVLSDEAGISGKS